MSATTMLTRMDTQLDNINVQSYINNFRRNISPYLQPNLALKAVAFPFDTGVIVEFEFVQDSSYDEVHDSFYSLEEALEKANLEIEDKEGNLLRHFAVKGTRIFLVENKIYLIKDKNEEQWSDKKSKEDIKKILSAK